MEQIGVYTVLEKDIYDKLKTEAEAEDRSIANMTRIIIKKFFERDNNG